MTTVGAGSPTGVSAGAQGESPERAGARARQWAGRGLIVGVACVAALGLAEVGLHVAGVAPDPGIFTVTQAEFERVPGLFAPFQSVLENPGSDFEHSVSINGLGFRGADFPLTKPDGQVRVFFTGDSFTWGHNVDDEDTLPAQLEAVLAEACGSVRVANAGLSGSSILAQQRLIERGLSIDPDLVVLMYHENDIDNLISNRMWDQLASNRRSKSRFPLSWVYPFVRETAIWNLALQVRGRLAFRGQEDAQDDGPGALPADVERARQEYRARLDSVASLLDRHEIPFLFVTFPHPESAAAGRGGRDYTWVLSMAEAVGVRTLDLLAPLADADAAIEDLYLVPEDYHPSPLGHLLAARLIASTILEIQLALPCALGRGGRVR